MIKEIKWSKRRNLPLYRDLLAMLNPNVIGGSYDLMTEHADDFKWSKNIRRIMKRSAKKADVPERNVRF